MEPNGRLGAQVIRIDEDAPELLEERIQITVAHEAGEVRVTVSVGVVSGAGVARRTSWTERRFSEALDEGGR
jgi:hypothetical protein